MVKVGPPQPSPGLMDPIATLALPDTHGLAVIGLALFALVVLTRPSVPQESTSLMVLMLLVLGFEVFPYEGSTGVLDSGVFLSVFGNAALITIAALLVIGRALEVTGALQPLIRFMLKVWAGPRSLALIVTLLVCAFMSAFLSNTLVVLAGVAAFAGTGPGYHATVHLVFDFALDQYGDLVAIIVVWLWWAIVAVLLFLLSLMAIVLTFVTAAFAVGRWLQ